MRAALGWGVLSFAFGPLVGLSEIVSRYRDEPLHATANRFGLGYLVLNGILAAAAYGVLLRYPTGPRPVQCAFRNRRTPYRRWPEGRSD